MNYSLKIDLRKLNGAFLGSVRGENCVIIPVEKNGIFCAQSGAAYLDLAAIELRQPGKFGGTHLVKRSLRKDERDRMTEAERNSQPILGDLKPFGAASVDAVAVDVDAPGIQAATAEAAEASGVIDEDLPF